MSEQKENREVPSNTAAEPYGWEETSESIKGVAGALSQLQGELHGVKEGGINPHFDSTFIELRDMVKVANPLLTKNGLSITQTTKPVDGRLWLITRLMHDESGTWIKGYWPMTPDRKGQQALGSEHTYARRQGFGGLLVIPPSEDDDAEASDRADGGEVKQFPIRVAMVIQKMEDAIGEHEEAVNEFLRRSKKIKTEQTFRDVDSATANEILRRPNDLIAKAVTGEKK